MKVKSESEVAQLCTTLSDPMDCSLPGSSVHVHGIFQVRVLEWVAIAFSRHLCTTEAQMSEWCAPLSASPQPLLGVSRLYLRDHGLEKSPQAPVIWGGNSGVTSSKNLVLKERHRRQGGHGPWTLCKECGQTWGRGAPLMCVPMPRCKGGIVCLPSSPSPLVGARTVYGCIPMTSHDVWHFKVIAHIGVWWKVPKKQSAHFI